MGRMREGVAKKNVAGFIYTVLSTPSFHVIAQVRAMYPVIQSNLSCRSVFSSKSL